MNASTRVNMPAEPEEVSVGAPSKKILRRILLMVIPLLVVGAGVTFYLLGGRYVSTDNSYIRADIAAVSPDVSGTITSVLVKDNQRVAKGDALLTIDDTNYRIGLAGAEASLRTAVNTLTADKAQFRQKEEALRSAATEAAFAEREFKRYSDLVRTNAVSAARVDATKRDLDLAHQKIALLKEERAEIMARLEGNPDLPIEQNPSYQSAMAGKVMAEHMIKQATIVAPFDGYVSQLPKVGDYARTGAPLLSVVAGDALWVEANFKETDLTNVRVGQDVDVEVDTYPGRVWHGHVESISHATGAEFALLPAQNSTGNWVKVVQRIPVHIVIDQAAGDAVLSSGMSVSARVDTGHSRIKGLFGRS